HLESAARLRPADAEARYRLGALLRDLGKREAALAELDEAVRVDRTHPRAAYERALALHDLGRYADAEKALEDFLFAFPADPFTDVARRMLEELRAP
ncbi:MAG: tetratricopeptide repeat protein, partial [Gemmatimonadetes bacterium]|nr:tetratricopeptide repeat protein [Gemmatimonadota bacterium]